MCPPEEDHLDNVRLWPLVVLVLLLHTSWYSEVTEKVTCSILRNLGL